MIRGRGGAEIYSLYVWANKQLKAYDRRTYIRNGEQRAAHDGTSQSGVGPRKSVLKSHYVRLT